MQVKSISFQNDEDIPRDTYLWRYMDIQKFISFISTESIYLTRLDNFEDSLEGISTTHLLVKHFQNYLTEHPVFDEIKNHHSLTILPRHMHQIKIELEGIQQSHFANCWVMGDSTEESVAMWNLYSSPDSLAIRIKYSAFKEMIQKQPTDYNSKRELILGPVKYLNFRNAAQIANVAENLETSPFLKDNSFYHENEFRLIVSDPGDKPQFYFKHPAYEEETRKLYDQIYNYKGIKFKLNNFNDFPFEIIFHPKCQEWAKKNIKWILINAGLTFDSRNSRLSLK